LNVVQNRYTSGRDAELKKLEREKNSGSETAESPAPNSAKKVADQARLERL
jgi:hypothetical protein